jgi:alpha-maltose-1-phosphate synthase
MRVLFVNENLGGHATMHLNLRAVLSERDDISADFLDVPAPTLGRRLAAAAVPGLGHLDADLQPLRAKLAAARWVRRRLAERVDDYDVIHLYTQNAALLSRELLRGRAWVVSTDSTNEVNAVTLPYRRQGLGTPLTTALIRRFEDPVLLSATRVVAQSGWVAEDLRERYGRPGPIPVIPFGILPPPDEPAAPRPAEPLITFVGATMAAKGGDLLLRAFDRLPPGPRLVLVTRDPVAPGPRVEVIRDMVPGDPRLSDLLRRTTVLVAPSRVDTFGYAALEAMAHGVPVVASDVGAHAELVEHGATGLIVPQDDEGAVLAALRTMLADPDRAADMGRAGRDRFAEHFDARNTTQRLVEVLREAMTEVPRRP